MSEKQRKDKMNRVAVVSALAGVVMGGVGLTVSFNKPESHDPAPTTHGQESTASNLHPIDFGKSNLRVAQPGEVVFGQSDLAVAPDKIVFGQSDLAVDPTQAHTDKVLIDSGMATGLHVGEGTTPPPPHGAR